MLADECLELRDESRMKAESQIRFDAILDCREAKLLEAPDLCLDELRVSEVGECGPAPQPQPLPQHRGGFGRIPALQELMAACEQLLETGRVHPLGRQLDDVAAGP